MRHLYWQCVMTILQALDPLHRLIRKAYRCARSRVRVAYLTTKFSIIAAYSTIFCAGNMPRSRQTFYIIYEGMWMSYDADRMFGW